jgi:glycosyltransferase involved in cell wall biosynthesis
MQTPVSTSVLVNNYNNERFLRHCVDSVLAQVPAAGEVIVYDDGSTDGSLDILRSYGDRIRILRAAHEPRRPWENQAEAIAAAFAVSTGELIFLLDGDDAFLPGKIAAYTEAFAKTRCVMVQAPLEKLDDNGTFLGLEYDSARHRHDPLKHIYAENDLNTYYPTSALAFSRDYLEARLPLDVEDGRPMWPDARLALLAPLFGCVVTLDAPLSQWRRHARSHTVIQPFVLHRLLRDNFEYFNEYCARSGRRTVSLWRCRQFRRNWIGQQLLPRPVLKWWVRRTQARRARV